MKKRYTVAQVRERLADALDEAESGAAVFIERRGVTYRLSVERGARRSPARRAPRIDITDATVVDGNWTWEWAPDGLAFSSRRRRP